MIFFSYLYVYRIGLEESNVLSDHGGSKYIQDLSRFLYPVLQTSFSKWHSCWRAQANGWSASTFHGSCDDKGPTVTIVRVGSYIFGGYTSLNWSSKLICRPNPIHTGFVWTFCNFKAVYPIVTKLT